MCFKNIRFVVSICGFVFLCLALGFIFAQGADAALTTFKTNDFSGSGVCAFCHSGLTDEDPKDVSMDAHWRSTMMANAAKDPFWQAKISAEVALVPDGLGLEQVIQEKCSRCHMGMARYQHLTDGGTKSEIYVLDTGFLDPAHYLNEAAMDGVSCTLCHQIQPDNLGTPLSYTGQYVIDTTTTIPDRLIFGPYSNPVINPMRPNSEFRPRHHAPARQLADSAHCGTCHTLYTPALSADGEYLKEFPEQTTYLEWKHSGFNRTCQDCHLPDAVGSVVISNRPRRLAARTPFGQHHYVGGNSFMVNLLKSNAGVLGVTADDAHLDATLSRTLDQLQSTTANLSAMASLTGTGDRLQVTVTVENLAGHKFPSGLPSRRTWLHVTVADADGLIVFESGKPLADGSGRIDGNDADENPANFEPHYDTITSSDQVQIYEPVMLNNDGEVTYTLLRAFEYVKDNRLLPAGFNKNDASPDIGVYGNAAVDDDNFVGGSDQVFYDVDVTGANGNLTVTVELLFQTLSYPFIEDLAMTPTPLVQNFMGLYNQEDNLPVVVAATPQMTVSR
jgi:hypothetical protein